MQEKPQRFNPGHPVFSIHTQNKKKLQQNNMFPKVRSVSQT